MCVQAVPCIFSAAPGVCRTPQSLLPPMNIDGTSIVVTRELTILRMVIPSFALVTELRATSNRLDEVLRIYVGDDPHKAMLSAAIQRGHRELRQLLAA